MSGLLSGSLGVTSRWSQGLYWLLAVGLFFQMAGFVFNNDGSRHLVQIYLLLMLPALVLLIALRGGMALWKQFPVVVLSLLMVWVIFIALIESESEKSPGDLLKVMLLSLLYVLAVAWLSCNERRLTIALVAVLVVVALGAWSTLYYQYVVLDRPLEYPKIRWFRLHELGWNGFTDLSHPIYAGLYFGFFGLIAVWSFLRFRVKAWHVPLFALLLTGLSLYILLTFSRGAWFSLLAGGLVLLLLFSNLKSRVLLGIGLLGLLAMLWLFWPEVQSERSIGVSNRDLIWADWFRRLPDFWLMGKGAGVEFGFTFPSGHYFSYAHSHYLQIWYEYGIVGFLLFVALLLSLLWKGWQCREQPLAKLGLSLLVFAMVAMVSEVHTIFLRPGVYWMMFWFPVGLLLGLPMPSVTPPSEPLAPPAKAD